MKHMKKLTENIEEQDKKCQVYSANAWSLSLKSRSSKTFRLDHVVNLQFRIKGNHVMLESMIRTRTRSGNLEASLKQTTVEPSTWPASLNTKSGSSLPCWPALNRLT